MQLRRRHFPNTVITKNLAHQKFYIHFFTDNSIVNFILYTLRYPKLKSGQLKVNKLMFALELSMKK